MNDNYLYMDQQSREEFVAKLLGFGTPCSPSECGAKDVAIALAKIKLFPLVAQLPGNPSQGGYIATICGLGPFGRYIVGCAVSHWEYEALWNAVISASDEVERLTQDGGEYEEIDLLK